MRKRGLGPIGSAIQNAERLAQENAATKPKRVRNWVKPDSPVIVVDLGNGALRVGHAGGRGYLIDKLDWPAVSAFRFGVCLKRVILYTPDPVSLHRYLLGPREDQHVDHINGDKLDNRRANLRICSPAENARNRRKASGSLSTFKGVTINAGRFQAQGAANGSNFYLGIFHTPEEAARAYDAFARREHGEFACVNFPLGGEQSAHIRGAV